MSDFKATSVLPAHSTALEQALEQASLWAILNSTIINTWNPDECPEQFLPFISWSTSGDMWDAGWSEENRRNYARANVSIHRKTGTLGAIKDALKAAGYGDAQVVERYGHEKYNRRHLRDGSIRRARPDHWAEYRITLARPITIDQATQVRAILKLVAPARCHLKALEFRQALNRYDGNITRNRAYTRGIA